MVAWVCVACQQPPSPYQTAALEAETWLTEQAIEVEDGVSWAADAWAEQTPSHMLSSGGSGILLFYSALYAQTRDERYRSMLLRGGDALLASIPDSAFTAGFPPGSSLYAGWGGAAYVLHQLYQQTGAERFQEGSRHLVQNLITAATPDGEGVYWSPVYNDVLFGGAGTGLLLLYAHEQMELEGALDVAERVAHTLQARAIAEHGGWTWRYREDRDFILPNFSHGAAGIGYFFARLYTHTQNRAHLETALGAARYLEAIAVQEDGGFRVPYGWPNASWDGLFDIGWAHGPAGTARLFYQLWQATGDTHWLQRTEQCAIGILQSGMPDAPLAGFGDAPFKNDRRFGLGSVAAFFIDLYRATDNVTYREHAIRLVDHLLALSDVSEGKRHWPMKRYTFMANGGADAAFTGYFYGTAGYALLLLELQAVLDGTDKPIILPDDPFVR